MPEKQSSGAFDIKPGADGPFSEYLNPVALAAPKWDSGQQPNGWEGKAGGAAFLGTKLLQGITDGRIKAYEKKERARLQTFDHVTQQMNAIESDPDINPEIKAKLRGQYAQMMGSVGQEQLKGSGSTKDKGVRGQVAGILNSVFEKLSGGPVKGDALTVDKMAEFMKTATEAIQSGASASSAYQSNFSLIQQGIEAAKKNLSGKWTTPTREEILNQPHTRQALSWFQQYAPGQLSIANDMLSGYPSQVNLKERAGAEIASGVQRPPSTEKKPGDPGAPPASGYLQNSYPAAPPKTDTGKKSPAEQEDAEWRQQLSEWAGVQQDVPIFDKKGDIVGYGPKATAAAIAGNNRMVNQIDFHADTEADKKATLAESKRRWQTNFDTQLGHWNAAHTERERVLARQDAEFAYRQTHDAKVLAQARTSEEKALNKFIGDATKDGHPFSAVSDNLDEYLGKYEGDPEISPYKAYIISQVAGIKNKQAGGSWSTLMGSLGGGNPTAPPKTDKKESGKPATPPKTDKISSAENAIGLN